MKRILLLLALLLCFSGRAKAQLEIPNFPSDPATCDPTRGLLYYNTTSNAVKFCSSLNTWSALISGAGAVLSLTGDGNIITNSASVGAVTLTIAGTSGGIPYFSSSSAWKSSIAPAANTVMLWGGAGNAPVGTSADSTTTHALFATAGAPAFRALAVGDIPTAIPIGNIGSAGLSATLPIRIAATGVIDCAGANQCVTSAASLTSTAIMTGAGGQGSQTPSATATLSGAGAMSLPSTLTATQLISNIAIGTAPLSVTSTTVVPNLNVSQLLGSTWAVPGTIGSTTPNTGAFTTLTANALEGCQHVNTSQSFATAFAAVTNPGCIVIDPGTGANYSVGANTTIPAGVAYVDQGCTLVSVATTFTLTINGQIIAPACQIFTYVGSGVVSIGQGAGPIHAIWFPGADMHAQWQNAYNAGPAAPSNFPIILDPNPAGGPWVTTTTVSMNTVNKYAQVIVNSPPNGSSTTNGFFDNFTPIITGSAATITNASYAGSTVTITAANSFSANQVVVVKGCTTTDYNGVWIVATASGTQFTYTADLSGGIAAGCSGTAAVSPYAIEIDWTPTGGGGYEPNTVLQGMSITNNGCFTNGNGACNSYATGILLGRQNAGTHAQEFANVRVGGFGVGIAKIKSTFSGIGWGTVYRNNSLAWNGIGLFLGTAMENDVWYGGRMAVNGVNLSIKGTTAEMTMYGGSMDSATQCNISSSSATIVHLSDMHIENNGVAGNFCVMESGGNPVVGNLDMKGGWLLDDNTTGNSAAWVTTGVVNVDNTIITSQGQGVTNQVFDPVSGGQVRVWNSNPGTIPNSKICAPAVACSAQIGGISHWDFIHNGTLQFVGIAAPSAALSNAVIYEDSTANWLKGSYNNGSFGFFNMNGLTNPTTGNVTTTSQCAPTSDAQDCFTYTESAAATGGTLTSLLANQALLNVATLSGSTQTPLEVQQAGITATTGPPIAQFESTWNNASLVGQGILLNVTNTSSAAGSLLENLRVGNATQWQVDKAGNGTATGGLTATTLTSNIATGTAPITVTSTTTVPTLVVSKHPMVQACGTTSSCSHTAEVTDQVVYGSAPLVSGTPSTVTISGISPAFTSTTSYVCTISSPGAQAATNLIGVTNVSASSFTITGPATVTTVISYICVGH